MEKILNKRKFSSTKLENQSFKRIRPDGQAIREPVINERSVSLLGKILPMRQRTNEAPFIRVKNRAIRILEKETRYRPKGMQVKAEGTRSERGLLI